MLKVSIRGLQKNPSEWVEKAPVEITRYGETIGYIVTPDMKPAETVETTMQKQLQRTQSTLTHLVSIAKTQEFEREKINLEICPKHKVYKKTCGCK